LVTEHEYEILRTEMRVIAGQYRSRPLKSLPGLDIRPSSDRLRETLFNILTAGDPSAIAGKVFFDLYAGTGAVGIEALSRGAATVYFLESSKKASDLILSNLRSLGVDSGFEILRGEVRSSLHLLDRRALTGDTFFLDPPYRLTSEYRTAMEVLAASSLLRDDSLVVAEHEKKFDPGDQAAGLVRFRTLKQGDTALSFYSKG
jgi:16S rRNA (guanine966-N2)-methyltransferase